MGWFSRKSDESPKSPGANPYNALLFAILDKQPALLQAAIDRGADANATTPNGAQPIVLAAVGGDEQVFDLMLQAGADVNRPDRNGGMTALHAAATKGHEPIVRRLLPPAPI